MFQAAPPLDFAAPAANRRMPPCTGLAHLVDHFETRAPEHREIFEDPLQRRARLRNEKMAADGAKAQAALQEWDAHNPPTPVNSDVTSDAYKTLFVARLSYDTTQHKLRREFEQYGPIKTLRIVQDIAGEARGYSFIEYEREADMKDAYKRSDGRKVDGRRVVVDVERGRTVRKWRPRRFGGGLGNTRADRQKGDKPRPTTSGRVNSVSQSPPPSQGQYGSGQALPPHSLTRPSREDTGRLEHHGGSDRIDRYRERNRDGGDRYSSGLRGAYEVGRARYEDRAGRYGDRGGSRPYVDDRRRARSRSPY